jgi:hypothetical protein
VPALCSLRIGSLYSHLSPDCSRTAAVTIGSQNASQVAPGHDRLPAHG